jgi:hypothetical protein
MTKKQIEEENKVEPVELGEEQLDAISGGPTAVENLMVKSLTLNFTPTTTIGGATTTTGGH